MPSTMPTPSAAPARPAAGGRRSTTSRRRDCVRRARPWLRPPPSGGGCPGSARGRGRGNASPRASKFANWSKEAQAGDSSTTGSRAARRGRVARRGLDRRVAASRSARRDSLPSSVAAKSSLDFADQIGLRDARNSGAQRRDAALLRPRRRRSSGCRRKDGSAFSAASALVALQSLTNSTRPMRPTCSMRCARPGKLRSAARIASRLDAERAAPPRWRTRRSGALCAPRSEPMPARSSDRLAAAARADHAGAVARTSRRRAAAFDRDAHDAASPAAPAGRAMARHQASSTPIDGASRRRATSRSLIGGVVLHRAVPVEMVGRDVEQDADARRRATARGRSGRTSTRRHARGRRRRRLEREDRRCRCCRPSARRSPAVAQRGARSAPSWSTCRWCR